ncbi:hypothetical protein ACP70R_022756 [Stipagrostis hirtigluma subsp. patula]
MFWSNQEYHDDANYKKLSQEEAQSSSPCLADVSGQQKLDKRKRNSQDGKIEKGKISKKHNEMIHVPTSMTQVEATYDNITSSKKSKKTLPSPFKVGTTALLKTAKYPNKAVVAYATFVNSSPKAKVDGVEIGHQFMKVLINHPVAGHSYHLVSWDGVCMLKDYGGLGIPNLRELNMSLLGSWIKRYVDGEDRLWKKVVDLKYKTDRPNVFACPDDEGSNFWKGVMWAAKAGKLGYRWVVGNGKKIKFWEDNWLGSSSLAIQFFEIYSLVNEKNKTIEQLWDGSVLKCSFRRCFDSRQVELWEEVVQLASTIVFTGEEDSLIWQFTSSEHSLDEFIEAVEKCRGDAEKLEGFVSTGEDIPARTSYQKDRGYFFKTKENQGMTQEEGKGAKTTNQWALVACNTSGDQVLMY